MFAGAILLIVAASGQTSDGPNAPLRNGRLQCAFPDAVRRTCGAITGITGIVVGSNRYSLTARIAVSNAPLTVLTMTADMEIDADTTCGIAQRADYMAASLDVGDRRLSPEEAAPALEALADMAEPTFGRRICTTMRPDGDAFVQHMTIDGVGQPDGAIRFIWIGAQDGYRLSAPH